MNKNKILISAFLLIFFFSLNSVSAMDDVDNAVIASDNQVISGEDNLIQSSLDDDIILVIIIRLLLIMEIPFNPLLIMRLQEVPLLLKVEFIQKILLFLRDFLL